jgi:hypothetical protein
VIRIGGAYKALRVMDLLRNGGWLSNLRSVPIFAITMNKIIPISRRRTVLGEKQT